jgi:hypothetical protein
MPNKLQKNSVGNCVDYITGYTHPFLSDASRRRQYDCIAYAASNGKMIGK